MNKPNILLISIDTLRADHLSCYGYHRVTTPNLDKVANQGVLFKTAYSTGAWTPPAHASMFTGLYPSQHGVVDEYKLDTSIPTLAGILSSHDYRTGGFINNSMVGELVGLHRGHEHFEEIWRGAQYNHILARAVGFIKRKAIQWSGKSDEGSKTTNERVLQWLKTQARNSKPFYLFIHYIDVHNPMKAPKPFRYKFLNDGLRKNADMNKVWKIADNPLICLTDRMTLNEDEIEALRCIYDEEIAYVDHKIGEILDYLKTQNILDDTFLIITADHGEHFGEHGLYSHVSSMYEPVTHIPLLIRYPELFTGGVQTEKPVQLVDILPTVLELLAVDYPGDGNLPGESLLSLETPHRDLFAEWEGRIPHFVRNRLGPNAHPEDLKLYTQPQKMILSDGHKFIKRANSQFELYDLARDPMEKNNIAATNPQLAEALKIKIQNWEESIECSKERELYELSSEAKRNLEGLGYI